MNAPTNGYYSLVQYCPEASRLEAVNMGVLLFCPELKFVDVKLASGMARARKAFPQTDAPRLQAALSALDERIRVDRAQFHELADLVRFVETRANEIVLTAPRPLKVGEPEDQLGQLFDELVTEPQRRRPRQPDVPELDRVFQRLHLQNRATLGLKVTVPVVNRCLEVPYGYRNDTWHLVKPQVFTRHDGSDTAMRLAVEGDLLRRHGSGLGARNHLVVVTLFEGTRSVRDSVLAVLGEYEVEAVPPEQVANYAARVEREAH